MSKISTPYGISYNIHGHNGYNASERIPHYHIMCQGKRISVSLMTGNIIDGSVQLDRNKEKEVFSWFKDNIFEFKKEWEEKSDPYR